MARIIIEQEFAQPMPDEAFSEMTARLDPCVRARNATWRRSYVSSDRTRMTCEYEAPDAETMREACRSAGVPFVRIWSAFVFTAEKHPRLKDELIAMAAKKP